MPTPTIIDGFDHRVASTTFFGTGPQGLWGAVSNAAGISFDTVNKRTGVAALKIAEDGVTATNISKAIPAGNRIIVVSIYFRVASAPSTGSRMLVVDGPTNKPQFRVGPDGRIGAAAAGGTAQWGPNVADGQWHRLDARVDVSGTTFTIDWQVDGTAQTQSAEAGTSADITYLRLGSGAAADTLTVWFDDLVASFTSADYPLGPHAVRFLVPDADGTHNNAANIMERASDGADIDGTTVTAWDLLDEWPPTTGTNNADTVTQANNGSANYVEVQFQDITDSTVWGVEALAALQSDGTAANNGQTRIRDADGTETTVWSGGMNQTSPRYNRVIVTVPTGGWTQSHVNALRARIGYSTDAAPDPEWLALALQVAVGEGAGPSVVTGSGAASCSSVMRGYAFSVVPSAGVGWGVAPVRFYGTPVVLGSASGRGIGGIRTAGQRIVLGSASGRGVGGIRTFGQRIVLGSARSFGLSSSAGLVERIVLGSFRSSGLVGASAGALRIVFGSSRMFGSARIPGSAYRIVSGSGRSSGISRSLANGGVFAIIDASGRLLGEGVLLSGGIGVVLSSGRLFGEGRSSAGSLRVVVSSGRVPGVGSLRSRSLAIVMGRGLLRGLGSSRSGALRILTAAGRSYALSRISSSVASIVDASGRLVGLGALGGNVMLIMDASGRVIAVVDLIGSTHRKAPLEVWEGREYPILFYSRW